MHNINGTKVNGRAKAIEWIEANDDVASDLENKILTASLTPVEEAAAEEQPDELSEAMAEEAAESTEESA
jgi:hypothetical protein